MKKHTNNNTVWKHVKDNLNNQSQTYIVLVYKDSKSLKHNLSQE